MKSTRDIIESYSTMKPSSQDMLHQMDNLVTTYNSLILNLVPWIKSPYISESLLDNLQSELIDYFDWARLHKFEIDRRTDLMKRIAESFTQFGVDVRELSAIGTFLQRKSTYCSELVLQLLYQNLQENTLESVTQHLAKKIGSATLVNRFNSFRIMGQSERSGIPFTIYFNEQVYQMKIKFRRKESEQVLQLRQLIKHFALSRGFTESKGGFTNYQIEVLIYIYRYFRDKSFGAKERTLAMELLEFLQFYAYATFYSHQFEIDEQLQVTFAQKPPTFEFFRIVHKQVNLMNSVYQMKLIQNAFRLSFETIASRIKSQDLFESNLNIILVPDPTSICIRDKCEDMTRALGDNVVW